MDSTSKLFSRLDLAENPTTPLHQKDMDDMDIDGVEEGSAHSLNLRMGSRRKNHDRHHRGSNHRTVGSSSTARNDTEQQRRRARLVQLINDTLESERPSLTQDGVLESEQNKVSHEGNKSRPYEKSFKFPSPERKKGKEHHPVFNGGDLAARGKREGIVLSNDSFQHDVSRPNDGQRDRRWPQRVNLQKHTGPRWHGCTSHTATDKSVANVYRVGELEHGELLDGSSSCQRITGPCFEGRRPDRKKGKMILEDNILRSRQGIKVGLHLNRHNSVAGKEVTVSVNDDNDSRYTEDRPWRRHDLTSKAGTACSSKIEQGTSTHVSDQRHKTAMIPGNYANLADDNPEITTSHRLNYGAAQAPPASGTGSRGNQRRQKFTQGKRKCNLIRSSYRGSSSSTFENSDTSYLQSPRHSPCTELTRIDPQYHENIFDTVIEASELQSPEIRFDNLQEQSTSNADHSNAGGSQVESDEILARQLQAQFYDEVAGSAGTEETDAALAWSLQQEDAQLAASTARGGQPDHREASMAHLYAYYAQLPYRNSSTRQSNRAHSQISNRRRNNYGPEIDLETRMVSEVRNFRGMDAGTRRNFLEALEAAFDQSNDTLPDFNENDYEMLLALDENNCQHVGASESQINSLPQSVIQGATVEETCAVCLENPTSGDVIRRLPCLHKFHKECIDTWLRRRTWCPVCKSEIN